MKTDVKQKQPTLQAIIDRLQNGEFPNEYLTINGIRVYISATEPSGDIPDGSIWIGGSES